MRERDLYACCNRVAVAGYKRALSSHLLSAVLVHTVPLFSFSYWLMTTINKP